MPGVKKIDIKQTAWEDERGWGLNPFDAAGIIKGTPIDLHVVSLKPGFVRGNHYHTNATEWIFICNGAARFLSKQIKEKTVNEILTEDNKPVFLEIQPNVEHAIMNVSKGDIYLVVFSSSAEPEMIRCPSLFDLDKQRV